MEAEKNKLTQKIRQRLRDYEKQPPEHIWDNIRMELSQQASINDGGLLVMFRKHWYVALALAAAVLLLLFVFSFASDAGIYNNNLTGTPTADNHLQDHINTLTGKTETRELALKSHFHHIEKRNYHRLSHISSTSQIKKETLPFGKLKSYDAHPISHATKADYIDTRTSEIFSNDIEYKANTDEITNIEGFAAALPVSDSWAFGFFATPELLYGKGNTTGGQPSYSADFAIMYKFNQYFVQSGFSLGSANDNSNANINYMQTEFMGSYQDVYDVTFDTTNGTPRPVYHTQEVEVYDTTEHQTSTLYTNSYSYLSLPLLMGYKQRFNDRFAYSLKAGPMVSFMLNEKSQFAFNYQDAQIQSIFNMPADRVTTNWQALLSVGLHYKLHKQVYFTLEPQMKYYFNPVYNTKANKDNPVALGLRTGLIVGF